MRRSRDDHARIELLPRKELVAGATLKLGPTALAAIRHSRQRVVTAAMDRMAFLYSIRMGELVTLSASVSRSSLIASAVNAHTMPLAEVETAWTQKDQPGEPIVLIP